MKRTKLDDRKLPTYTRGEDVFNMTSHIIGAIFGIIVFLLCLIKSIPTKDSFTIMAAIIYGISFIELYVMSSIYHGLKTTNNKLIRKKKIMQIVDHCSIYILIAGSYTPYALISFREYDLVYGWALFAFVWGIALIGIILDSIDLRKFRVISKVFYFTMGWIIIFRINILPMLITWPGTILLLLGGITYTIGSIFFAIGMKKKWFHSIFHIFILISSILQFLSIYLYVL